MNFETTSLVNRRSFLKAGVLTAAAARLGGSLAVAAEDKRTDPFFGLKMGLQSYTLREFDVNKALAATKQLGLSYWESFPGHIKVATLPNYVNEQKQMLAKAEVKVIAFGVVGFDANESKAREAFEFAKALGIESLSADPVKDEPTFKLLDRLVEEYKINIGIHNHGPGHRWDKISDVVEAVKGRHPRIGACVDTGHYLRSKESPVEAMERLKDRLFGVHLKDVRDAKIFTILGEGDLDVAGCMKFLKQANYKYSVSLEYEENAKNPVPDLEVCLKNLRTACAGIV
jgi:inosose dehydratase